MMQILQWFVLGCACVRLAASFSASPNSPSSVFGVFDRFRATCPADRDCIRLFEPTLISSGGDADDETWVAVYRSVNNKPSVFAKDDFLNAMRIATTEINDENIETNVKAADNNIPVAVARLRHSRECEGTWVLDSMRCMLKKEDTNPDCDGGSDHVEAISVCVDELILRHLQTQKCFQGALRCKATLVSGKVLEDRGFLPVEQLTEDMATHVSDLDKSMECYADRIVNSASKLPGARDRALQIISLLGQLDREEEYASASKGADDADEDEYDPWAGFKQFI